VPTWPTDSLSSGFVYVRETEPENPEEGETWYDLNANEAKVYDGGVWHLLTVTEHSEIGGISAGQHRSDSNIRSTVDGQVDADTVDGQHASDLGGLTGMSDFRYDFNISSADTSGGGESGAKSTDNPVWVTNINLQVDAGTGGTASDYVTTTAYVSLGGKRLVEVSYTDDGASSGGPASKTATMNQLVDQRWTPNNSRLTLGYEVEANTSGSYSVDAALAGIELVQ